MDGGFFIFQLFAQLQCFLRLPFRGIQFIPGIGDPRQL
jgi:hypothetical protein